MSDKDRLLQIEDPSRRSALRFIALAVTAAAGSPLKLEAARHVHLLAKEEQKESGTYKPKLFNDREYRTIQRLCELIVPADNVSGSAKDAGAPEFIDLLCSQNEELAAIYTGGLAWLDAEMMRRYSAGFADAGEKQRTAMLDALVAAERESDEQIKKGLTYQGTRHYEGFGSYGFLPSTDLGPGVHFFGWIRKMAVDAFYTSEIGIKDVGYMGNQVLVSYEVPQDALDYALKRSPFSKA